MAMYHFRIKTDKKPDGTRISPVQHVEYIRREGNYAEEQEWQENNQFVGNLITSAEVKNVCKDFYSLLYKTDNFGSIRNTEEGLEVTEKATLTTIAVALMLADETMNHKPLIVSGSNDFIKQVIETAVFEKLPITFADKRIQNEIRRQKEKQEIERRNFIANGGKIFTERANFQPITQTFKTRKLTEVIKRGLNLLTLSELNQQNQRTEVTEDILTAEEISKLNKLEKNAYSKVRWNFSEQYLNLAKQTAQQILKNIEEKLNNVNAESHVEYINREKAFANRGGCIFHSHKLPKWAKDDPKKFFKAADKYEGIGNRRYVEIEFALPNELKTVEQYRQIIDAFIAKHLSNHYYAYAIHEKIGMMSEEQRHPHVHIMFSERLIDEVEKIRERTPPNFFKYPARKKKDGTEATFEEKYRRGSPRDRKWCSHQYVCQMRADLAKIENEVLEKNGYSIRVDHRTLKAQKEEAEKKAKLEYMTPAEREIWRNYFEMLGQKKQLEKFLTTLKKPDESQKDSINAYDEMVSGVKSKIGHLLISAASLKKSIEEINKKLEAPDCKKNILLVTHQILQANTYARKMLRLESEKLDRSVDELKDSIFFQSISDKEYYKTREVYNILRQQYFSLKKEHEKQLDLKYSYKQKIISPLRAVAMAKNIFVKGDLKKLRASFRQLHKDSEKFVKNLDSFNQREEKLKNAKCTTSNQADFLQEKYLLAKEKMELESERGRLDQLKLSLENQKSELETALKNPDALKQIQLIAAGILRKNRKFVEKFEETNKKLQGISERLKHTKAQIDVVELQLKSERHTTFYKVLEPKYSDKTAATLIADAMLGEPQAAQLVARSSGNNLEMEKTWELLSDLDKDEIRHQKIFRDL